MSNGHIWGDKGPFGVKMRGVRGGVNSTGFDIGRPGFFG